MENYFTYTNSLPGFLFIFLPNIFYYYFYIQKKYLR